MRTDEEGNACPATLGEYRDLCAAIGGENCAAVWFLDRKIAAATTGRDDLVVIPDSQARALLMPLLITPKDDR
jgi:hypothetical protein